MICNNNQQPNTKNPPIGRHQHVKNNSISCNPGSGTSTTQATVAIGDTAVVNAVPRADLTGDCD